MVADSFRQELDAHRSGRAVEQVRTAESHNALPLTDRSHPFMDHLVVVMLDNRAVGSVVPNCSSYSVSCSSSAATRSMISSMERLSAIWLASCHSRYPSRLDARDAFSRRSESS